MEGIVGASVEAPGFWYVFEAAGINLVVDGGVEIFCEQAVWVLFGQVLYGVVCFRYFEPGAEPV